MVSIGSDAQRQIDDAILTLYACYLIAQNEAPAFLLTGQRQFTVYLFCSVSSNISFAFSVSFCI